MRKAAPVMAKLAMKVMKGEKLGASVEDGYMNQGIRVNFFDKDRGSKRAVKMLLNKLADKPFTTEYPMPSFDRVAPNPAINDLEQGDHRPVHLRRYRPQGQPPTTSSPLPPPTTVSTVLPV